MIYFDDIEFPNDNKYSLYLIERNIFLKIRIILEGNTLLTRLQR